MSNERNGINRAAAVNTATVRIRRKIVKGEYTKGMSLTETQLAEECALSRGSIRSALSVLESEGLILSKKNGRKEVLGITIPYVMDLYDMRMTLELKGLHAIIEGNAESDYDYISSLLGSLGGLSQADTDDSDLYAKKDMIFHRTLIQLAGNRTLECCWNVVEAVIWTLQSVNSEFSERSGGYENHVAKEHSSMLQQILARDPAVYDAMRRHIQNAQIATIKILEKRGNM